jgi:hypothetical protein
MEVKFLFLTALLVIISGCSQPNSSDPEFFGANFSLSSCVQNAGDVNALEMFMKDGMKIKKQLSPDLSKFFLNGSSGKVWSLTSPDGSYAVAYRDDDVCTVFIKEANVAKYISHMNQSIKRISEKSDWKFSTDKIPMFAGDKKLKTYEFSVVLPNKKVRIIISAVNHVAGNFQVALSTNIL